MASTGSKRHTHKYMKVKQVWCCALPDCTHFMPRNMPMSVTGKASICWNCGEEFILDERSMKEERPICFECTDAGKVIKEFDIEEFERQQRLKNLKPAETLPLIGD